MPQNQDQSGVTYGPAVTRRTRTPISFSPFSDKDQSGNYTGPALIPQLLNLIPHFPHSSGSIEVDPNSPDNKNLSTTIKHEEIHSLLNDLNFTGKMKDLASQNPYYKVVAAKLAGRGGDPILETPAYMGAFDPSDTPAQSQDRNNYVNYLAQQLVKMDPKIGTRFKDLAGLR